MCELLTRVLRDDLEWEVPKRRVQAPGEQYGKDLQIEWAHDGRTFVWHFECKSHRTRFVTKEEVLPKLFDAWRSSHDIDVWCLALAGSEPGQAIDELLPALAARLRLPFNLVTLSPGEHALQEVFACHPDLYAQVYPDGALPALDEPKRRQRIESFGQFLLTSSLAAREPRSGEWTLVIPERPDRMRVPPDDDDAATAYLRGLERSDWDCVAHGWVVDRPSATAPVEEFVKRAAPGASYMWLAGPAGEGKTTAARMAAWSLAKEMPDTIVLWGEAETDALRMPVAWIDALADGSNVVLFVDGTRRLRHAGRLQARSRDYATRTKRVSCVFVDRGIVLARSRARKDLGRSRGRSAPPVGLPPLSEAEAEALAIRLFERQILFAESVDAARTRLTEASRRELRAGGVSWLLPTMMELTDPERRGFDKILVDLLDQLRDLEEPAALFLLLVTALAHGARVGLRSDIAALVVDDQPGGYVRASEVLSSEITRHFLGARAGRVPRSSMLLYNGVVADGFIRAATCAAGESSALSEACRRLVASVGLVSHGQVLANELFDLLHEIARYLTKELSAYETGAEFLDAWIRLDDPPENFVAMQRLGDCLQRWFHREIVKPPETRDLVLVQQLLDNARATFEEGLSTAEALLSDPSSLPPSFANRTIDHEERVFFTSWAVLEDLAGTHLEEGRSAHLQAALLSVLGLAPGGDGIPNIATLALNLIHLELYDDAAKLTSALEAAGGHPSIVRSQRRTLQRENRTIPVGGLTLLASVVADLATGLLLTDTSDDRWPYSRRERARRLSVRLTALARSLPDGDVLATAAATLDAEA